MQVGGFLASWIIAYGMVQAIVPKLIKRGHNGCGPDGRTAKIWAFMLASIPALIAMGLSFNFQPEFILLGGGFLFLVLYLPLTPPFIPI